MENIVSQESGPLTSVNSLIVKRIFPATRGSFSFLEKPRYFELSLSPVAVVAVTIGSSDWSSRTRGISRRRAPVVTYIRDGKTDVNLSRNSAAAS